MSRLTFRLLFCPSSPAMMLVMNPLGIERLADTKLALGPLYQPLQP
jgi:hypothetical protein